MNLTNPPSRIDNQDVVDAGTQPRVAAKGLALGDVELGVLNPTCVITDLTVTCGESSSAGYDHHGSSHAQRARGIEQLRADHTRLYRE